MTRKGWITFVVLGLLNVAATLYLRHDAWWDGWEAGYRRDRCDHEQATSGVVSPYCDDIDEWGRKK